MKLLFSLFLLLLSFYGVGQQGNSSKYSAGLKLFLADKDRDPRFLELKEGINHVPLFIELEKGSGNLEFIRLHGGQVRTVAGNVITADVPLYQLEAIASQSQVKRMELPLLLRRSNDTIMKKLTTVDKVLSGAAPLTMPYTGQGVVMGIIDDGIEFGHPEFLDSNGKTTVHSIWNMDGTGTPPPGYQYGKLWEKDSLDYFLNANYNTGSLYQWQQKFGSAGHGTPVASLAAGKNGVAPGATLVVVSLTAFLDTLLRSDRIIDGIAFIYNQARSLDKKCVINISLGTQWGGPHDGKTLVEQAIDNYCSDKPDLLVCTSAGNDGNNWKHWGGFPIHADSSFGFARLGYEGSLYFSIPRENSSYVSISITDTYSPLLNSPVISRDSILFQTPFLTVEEIIQSNTPLVFYSYLKNGLPSAMIRFSASHSNEDYDELIVHLKEFTSKPSGPIDYHINRFIFKGRGVVHGYFPFFNLHPLYFFNNNPYPNDPTYRSTDNEYTTAIPTNAFSVLSSGAYNLRSCFVNKRMNKIIGGYEPCRLTYFTSKGPTFDGRIKPDVISPGENVLSAHSRWNSYYGHEFILDSSTQLFGGTSASSPITAGVAALVWEKFPSYTRDSVIERIKATSYADNYTASVPGLLAGWGKVDAFKALTGMETDLTNACTPYTCILPNPPLPPPPASGGNYFNVFPNPSSGSVFIRYISGEPLRLQVFNLIGQEVHAINLGISANLQTKSIHLSHLAAGYYFFRVNGREYSEVKTIFISR